MREGKRKRRKGRCPGIGGKNVTDRERLQAGVFRGMCVDVAYGRDDFTGPGSTEVGKWRSCLGYSRWERRRKRRRWVGSEDVADGERM